MTATRSASETFRGELLGLVNQLHDHAVSLLGEIRDFQLAARSLNDIEAARLARQTSADAPRVQALRARAGARVEVARSIDVEAQIAAVRVPRVETADTLIQGRITDSAARGVAAVAVQLVDETGKRVSGVEEVRTDANGYYAIVLKPAEAEALADQKLKVAIATDAGQVQPTQATLALQTGSTLTQEVKLDDAALASLNLRPTVSRTAETTKASTPRSRKK